MLLPTVLVGGDEAPLLIRDIHREIEAERFAFEVQSDPRGRIFHVGLSLMIDADDLAPWRLPEGADGRDVGAALVTFALANDQEGDPANRVWVGESFTHSLIDREPATDSELVNYVAGKIYWSWLFGLTHAEFTYSDDLLVGLVRRSASRSLLPSDGQLSRAAQWGAKTYWDEPEKGRYIPTRRLLEEFPILEAIRGSLDHGEDD